VEENKVARFWEIEKELRKILLPINVQLELTHQVLNAQLPKVQELFLQLTQLGEELGFDVDRSCLQKLYDYLGGNGSFYANDVSQNDMRAENGH
jgi:hypothetical protein